LRAWDRDPVACTRFCEQPDLMTVGGTKNPDVDAIVDLAPDLVVVDAEENRREDHDALVAAGLDVHVLTVTSVDAATTQMADLAHRLGVAWRPRLPTGAGAVAVRAFVPIWRRPWMSIGGRTYGSDLLAKAGVANVLADAAEVYPTVELDDVAALGPDVVLAPSEPYEFGERHLPELASVAPTVFVDGRDLFWWGVRTPGAIARLAELAAASTVQP
jgi:ABC-type Fe3+-hydroxamate transport system substrate-binding protein